QGNRYETVTVNDGRGPQVAQLTTSFVNGAWIHAAVQVAAGGTVAITVHRNAGNSAVLAGIFFGGAGAPPAPLPAPPIDNPGVQGSWVGTYGHDGYILGAFNGTTDLAVVPAGVTYSIVQGGRATWAATTTDVRGLQSPDATQRRARTFYDNAELVLQL